jgi:hypothetical protein
MDDMESERKEREIQKERGKAMHVSKLRNMQHHHPHHLEQGSPFSLFFIYSLQL